MRYLPVSVLLLLLLICCAPALAQPDDTCTFEVETVLSIIGDACGATGRNQACYGNLALEVEPRVGVIEYRFQQTGDLMNVIDIATLRLDAYDPEENLWGVALMKLQANLPDTLPGQNVTLLLYGDVEIENAVEPQDAPVLLEIISGQSINVRSGPSTNHAVVGSLSAEDVVTADGRNQVGDWLHIQLDDDRAGWVFANLVTVDGDVSTLAIVEASAPPARSFTPMQAIYLTTGIGVPGCADIPESGVLMQTPAGSGRVELSVNGVDVSMGSTVLFQAQRGGEMHITTIEGSASATYEGRTYPILAGSRLSIPLSEDLLPLDVDAILEGFTLPESAFNMLSLLDEQIEPAAALEQAFLDEFAFGLDFECSDDPSGLLPPCSALYTLQDGMFCFTDEGETFCLPPGWMNWTWEDWMIWSMGDEYDPEVIEMMRPFMEGNYHFGDYGDYDYDFDDYDFGDWDD